MADAHTPEKEPAGQPDVLTERVAVQEQTDIALHKEAKELRPAAMRDWMKQERLEPPQLIEQVKKFDGKLIEATAVWRQEAIDQGKEPLHYVALRTAALVGPETLAA